jgi:hypothetical protein
MTFKLQIRQNVAVWSEKLDIYLKILHWLNITIVLCRRRELSCWRQQNSRPKFLALKIEFNSLPTLYVLQANKDNVWYPDIAAR